MGNDKSKQKDQQNPSNRYICNDGRIERLNKLWNMPEIVDIVNRDPNDKTPLSITAIPQISSFFNEFKELWLETKDWNEELKSYFNEELWKSILLFYNDYDDFLMPISNKVRNEKGKKIYQLYIDNKGDCTLNLSQLCKNKFRQSMIKNNYQYKRDSFDMVIVEILYLIKYKIWPGLIKACNHNIRIIKTISMDRIFSLENRIVIKHSSQEGPDFADIIDAQKKMTE